MGKFRDLSGVAAAAGLALCAAAADIEIDFDTATGRIKPVHSVGQGPLLGIDDYSMFKFLKEANIPYARLHDVGGRFGGNVFVDIPNLFRDFDADENDPANYDFTFTDRYLKALVDNGVEPYFRLGVTIEVFARTVKAYRIFPPKDYAKWARICEHVIRHYTEGWANGFRYKITYWEIWNEPDDFPDNRNAMWRGSWRDFCELYEVASKHLKAKFPHLKIGGYGKCTANSAFVMYGDDPPEEDAYRHKCFVEFCDFIKERKCPLDFFSFHAYIQPDHVRSHVDYHRRILRNAGYGDAELHLNEWLSREWLSRDTSRSYYQNEALASATAAFLVAAQTSDLQMANIYDARCRPGTYCPLFDPATKQPGKAFYALKYFGELYRLGTAAKCKVVCGIQGHGGLWAVAAKGEDGEAALIVNDSPGSRPFTFDFGGRKIKRCRIVDASHTDEETDFPSVLPPASFMLVEFER